MAGTTIGKYKRIGLIATTAVVALMGCRWAVPAIAAKAEPFIDKEFQAACVKHFEKRFFNFIDATDEQQSTIDKLIASRMDETLPLREKLRAGMSELKDLMVSNDAKDEQIVDKAHELRAMHEKLMDQRLDTVLKIRQTLTPEQRKAVGNRIEAIVSGGRHSKLLHRFD